MPDDKPLSRYLRIGETAAVLGIDRTSVYPLLQSHGGPIAVATPGAGKQLRVVRASLDAYCERIEREAAERFRRSAS